MPLQTVFPPSIPLRYQLLHDTFTCLLHTADITFTALLLHYYYTHHLDDYFNATISLVALASLFLTLHFTYITHIRSRIATLLYLPAAFTAPLLLLLASYRLPPLLPRSLLPRLLPSHYASLAQPTVAVDAVKQYQLYSLYRHNGFHFHAVVWTAPISIVTLVYIASHQHDTGWLHTAALLVQICVILSRTWMFAFSVHMPTLVFLLLLIQADVLNLYSSVLLLASSTASQPLYHVWFFTRYTHASLFNSILLNKDFTLFLLFSFVFLCLVVYAFVRQLTLRQLRAGGPQGQSLCVVVCVVCLQFIPIVVSFVMLFAMIVSLLFVLKTIWLVILLYCVGLYDQWVQPVFYRRLYAYLTASSTFASSTAHSTFNERVYIANQYFAQRALTLYPPPVCTTPAKRHLITLAQHTLSLQPNEFNPADLMRVADVGVWLGCQRAAGAVHALLVQHPVDWLYQRIGRKVGYMIVYVAVPCYVASMVWDVVWPIIAAVYLAAYGGCASGGGLLAVIVGCVYGAVLLAAVLLLPSVVRFHGVMHSVLRYDLPRVQHAIDRCQPDKRDQPASANSDSQQQQGDQPVAVTRRQDDWRLLPFNVDGDTLSDWPHQISALLYSRMLRAEVRSALMEAGMMEPLSDMVASYLPAMERERAGQLVEDGDWIEKWRRRQWLAVGEPSRLLLPPAAIERMEEDGAGEEKKDDESSVQIELVVRGGAVDDVEEAYARADIPSPCASAPPTARPGPPLALSAHDRWRMGLRPTAPHLQRTTEEEMEAGEAEGVRFERMRDDTEDEVKEEG